MKEIITGKMAPCEWQPVTVALCLFLCFGVFLFFCHIFSCSNLNRRCTYRDAQLLRLCMCIFLFLELFQRSSVDPFRHDSIVSYSRTAVSTMQHEGAPREKTGDPHRIKLKEKGMQSWNEVPGEEKKESTLYSVCHHGERDISP